MLNYVTCASIRSEEEIRARGASGLFGFVGNLLPDDWLKCDINELWMWCEYGGMPMKWFCVWKCKMRNF